MPTSPAWLKSPHKEVMVPVIDRIFAALRRNGREGLSTRQLSDIIGPTPTTMSLLMEKPLKQGLVTRRRYGGKVIYSITTEGMENTNGKREK